MSGSEAPCLHMLQRWFLETTTTSPLTADAALLRAETRRAQTIDAWVKAGKNESALERVSIYQRAYWARLTECLADDYPALKACLGASEFENLCRDYIAVHPSRHANLNRFGQFLPEFLARTGYVSRRFLGELAQLEWSLVQCVHAHASDGDLLRDLHAIPAERLGSACLVPSASLRLLEFEYPTNLYLQAYFDDQPLEIPSPEKNRVAVVRAGAVVWRFDLEEQPFELLSRLTQRHPLAQALNGLDMSAANVRDCFARWVEHGFFSSVSASAAK